MADDKKSKSQGAKAPKEGGKARSRRRLDVLRDFQGQARPSPKEKPRLAQQYDETVLPALMEKFEYTSVMQAPRLVKIVLNMGVGDAISDQKLHRRRGERARPDHRPAPAVRHAKKAISNFKLREGLPIGCMVTLRGARMFEFFDRLINVALPRIRDFRGITRGRSMDAATTRWG